LKEHPFGRVTLPVPQVVSNSLAIRARLVETGGFITMLPGSTLHLGEPTADVQDIYPHTYESSSDADHYIKGSDAKPDQRAFHK
jgi:hypothetical protein